MWTSIKYVQTMANGTNGQTRPRTAKKTSAAKATSGRCRAIKMLSSFRDEYGRHWRIVGQSYKARYGHSAAGFPSQKYPAFFSEYAMYTAGSARIDWSPRRVKYRSPSMVNGSWPPLRCGLSSL